MHKLKLNYKQKGRKKLEQTPQKQLNADIVDAHEAILPRVRSEAHLPKLYKPLKPSLLKNASLMTPVRMNRNLLMSYDDMKPYFDPMTDSFDSPLSARRHTCTLN